MPFEIADIDSTRTQDVPSVSENAAIGKYRFEGYFEFFGYHAESGGWFIGGWIAHPWPVGHRPNNAVAMFEDQTIAEQTRSMFYYRDELSGRGIGFLFFLRSASAHTGALASVSIECAGVTHSIFPLVNVRFLHGRHLVEHVGGLLAGGEDGPDRQEMRSLLPDGHEPVIATGFIEFYGYHALAGGWLICGWMGIGWRDGQAPRQILMSFDEGDVCGEAVAVLFPRDDLRDAAQGIALFVRGVAKPAGNLCAISFDTGNIVATLYIPDGAERLGGAELELRLRPIVDRSIPGGDRDLLSRLISCQSYRGEDTLQSLGGTVLLEIDAAFLSGRDGLVLIGWCLSLPNQIREIRVRCGSLVSLLDLENCLRVARPDVAEKFADTGFDGSRAGFIAFLPHAVIPDSPIVMDVETSNHQIGYRKIPRPGLDGLVAIKRLLSAVDVRFSEVPLAFDHVLGPAVEGLNSSRLANRPSITVSEYGQVPANPRFSVIVPLYGRLDFVEYQLALFSAHPGCTGVEFIYVLDDPPRLREAQVLFASVYERFLVPFRVLLLDRNVGFAPATNIGLATARGTFIAFMNSDVFPDTPDWLEQLSRRLTADPSIGAIGPLLLFEDGSVQHSGMCFRRVPEFGNYFFGMHSGKGLRPAAGTSLEAHPSITGACMVMTREMAQDLGGFDETYVIGDFEDSDVCLRLQARGYRCVVDTSVRMFHLERKSQASSNLGWRLNLMLYNAWQHDRRWGKTIAALQEA